MSHTYSAKQNYHQEPSTTNYQKRFETPNELFEDIFANMPIETEVDLQEDSDKMRQEFRRLARRMRRGIA